MRINRAGLDRELGRQVGPILKREGRKKLMRVVNEVHRKLMSEFENHPVTQEIEAGPGTSNISGTLNGYGDLFSYIGFDAGDNPIMAIKIILEKQKYLMALLGEKRQILVLQLVKLQEQGQVL